MMAGSVQLWGGSNVASQMPNPASRLYAQNVWQVINLMTGPDGFAPDFDDEIVAAMCVTRGGSSHPHRRRRSPSRVTEGGGADG